ncbi:MAG: YlxR family protein [Chloroflexi bacterium]|nr:YlxR family protein [Chloroflexota bacterium]
MKTRTTSKGSARRLPQRTCVGCRRSGDQSSFVRLIRVTADDTTHVEVDDAPRRTAGRGAYLCRDQECWERGLRGALGASLRAPLDASNREALMAYAERFAAIESSTATRGAERTSDGDTAGNEGEDS